MIEMTNVLPVQGNKILLAMKKRGHGMGRWNGMGGKVEANETIKAAAIREAEEEVGITITALEKYAELIFDELHKGKREQIRMHIFVATKWRGEPAETEEMAPRWFSLADIPYSEMWADDIHWLPQVLAGKRLRGTFHLNAQDVILSHELGEVNHFD